MNDELLLAALHRHGAPCTAGELTDVAVGLAMGAGWPRRTWESPNVRAVSRQLQVMADVGSVIRCAARRENGREVPTYGLGVYDRATAVPDAPQRDRSEHPLSSMTARQRFTLFDVQDALLQTMARHRDEHNALLDRHARELADLAARNRRELVAVGLEVPCP